MWIYVAGSKAAFNLDHVARVFVEETGTGAALKSELAGKTIMIAYFDNKADAMTALDEIMEKCAADAVVVRF